MVMSLLYMMAVWSSLTSVYGSRSEEEIQREDMMEERQVLKPLMKPVMIKRDNLMQSKGYPSIISKSGQPVKYVRVPVEGSVRSQYARNALYGAPLPIYQEGKLPKNAPRPVSPKVVYVVQPRSNEQPLQVVYHDNPLYPDALRNYISETSANRIPIVHKHLQGTSGYEDGVRAYSQYGGLDYFPHQEIWSSYVYREPVGKEKRVMVYSDGTLGSVRPLPEFTGNELQTYPKYEYKTFMT